MTPDRHQCEVRHILKLRIAGQLMAMKYIQLVMEKRGKVAADKLKSDASTQWNKHNRGVWGDWR